MCIPSKFIHFFTGFIHFYMLLSQTHCYIRNIVPSLRQQAHCRDCIAIASSLCVPSMFPVASTVVLACQNGSMRGPCIASDGRISCFGFKVPIANAVYLWACHGGCMPITSDSLGGDMSDEISGEVNGETSGETSGEERRAELSLKN